MNKRHPTLQLFYLTLMACCYYVFWRFVFVHLPEDGLTRPTVVVSSALAIFFYGLACWVDPGIVKSKAERAQLSRLLQQRDERLNGRYSGDGVLFPLDKDAQDCRTCLVPKPARSKHCSVCGHCVRRFDHHCAWINQDVGEGNIFCFHLFLVWHVVLSLFYAGLCWLVVAEWVTRERLWTATFVTREGVKTRASWQVIIMFSLGQHPAVVALGLFAALIAVMLFVFWLSHLRNAARNQTSNEAFKTDEYAAVLYDELKAAKQKNSKPPGSRENGPTPVTKASVDAEIAKARSAYDLGSRWTNICDTFSWIEPRKHSKRH